MFICEKCIDDYEGAPIEIGKLTIQMGRGSLGPCEMCGKVGVCADVPSSAPWGRKREEKE